MSYEQRINRIDPEIRELAKKLVSQMTVEEKSIFHVGMGGWHTCPIERLLIPAVMMTDGPHGLRKKIDVNKSMTMDNTQKATCFPAAVSASCSYDRDLIFEMGVAMAEECIAEDVAVILGPAANIKRSPLCGRNFEYISEDPYITGEYAASLINGVQSKNVGTSLKHFCANNQEFARLASSSVIDERALREIYLAGFEAAIKKAQPFTVMCSYNKINGTYAASNKRLLTDILRNEWGFEGAVMTDWGAMDDRKLSVEAGLDLEMPAPLDEYKTELAEAINDNTLDEDLLDICAERVLSYVLATVENKHAPYDMSAHNELARRIARESAVLLKNDSKALPIAKSAKVAVIGHFAKVPRYQGAGSSKINPHTINAPVDELAKNGIDYIYADGYSGLTSIQSEIDEAVKAANAADVVLAFVGIPDEFESEGFDRTSIDIPESHNTLISALIATNKPVVAVVMSGSAVDMPWRNEVSSILLMNIAGQNVGGAVYDLVFGDYSPCGKLTESFPNALVDSPAKTFGASENVDYTESIFVGYRYYDKAKQNVAFPFGFGLSYTTFEYSNLRLSADKISDTDTLTVTLTVKNTGAVKAKEIVQLYVAPPETVLFKPVRELREYAKVELAPNEETDVTFTLTKRAFSYYNTNISDWHVESGIYRIELCSSSRDVRLTEEVCIASTVNAKLPDYRKTAPCYYSLDKFPIESIPHTQFAALFDSKYPQPTPLTPFTKSSTTRQLKTHFFGKQIAKVIEELMLEKVKSASPEMQPMLMGMMYDTPLRSSITLPREMMKKDYVEGIVQYANGHVATGKKLIKRAMSSEDIKE